MAIPKPIGPVHYDQPRAVKVREPENLGAIHSAVHGAVAIYVESVTEAQAVMSAWPIIMQAAADKTVEVLGAIRKEAATT